jgi:hypothetical protein
MISPGLKRLANFLDPAIITQQTLTLKLTPPSGYSEARIKGLNLVEMEVLALVNMTPNQRRS